MCSTHRRLTIWLAVYGLCVSTASAQNRDADISDLVAQATARLAAMQTPGTAPMST